MTTIANDPFALQDPALLRRQPYVDGRWRSGDGAPIAVANPATGASLGEVETLSPAAVIETIDAAERALPAWKALPARERANRLERWHDLILQHADDLARIMTLEQGKPLAEARGEIAYGASFAKWFAGEAVRAYGEIVPTPARDRRVLVLREAVGVCAAITPWNFPSAMIVRKTAPALAAGCTIVLKPAETTPFSALALAELAQRAAIPAGVFNVVLGDPPAIGKAFAAHPAVRKLSFTGSTRTGRLLLAQAAEQVQKVTLELGGNAPFIVFDDADVDAAVEGAIAAKFRNAGQVCVAVNRIFAHESVAARFTERLAARAAALKVGNGLDPDTQVGPLINRAALDRVAGLVDDVKTRGGKIVAGGKPHKLGGLFFEPTVVAGAPTDACIWREEIFGPLVTVTPFRDETEALRLANATEYGLASYFYTRDLGRAFRVAEGLQFGMVGVNVPFVSSECAPFGGVKASGIGREGSRHGIEDYLEIKTVWVGGI
ncbi:MAG: NAD-dependent succinate-semialdehyde dehydrogenase [Azoarcus sp.]|jgi:succinate-semialdehyde dehydrogenase/glutarate-semialdehyde dehydrogenase|nr:NAD-dependent succinate-semialdehyde dehydrogenase [Azoarcus sp.]